MQGEAPQPGPTKPECVELLLSEIDSLPTLNSVAVRLLELTADDESDADEVIGLIASDPAMSSKVLALCRYHDRGRASHVSTIDRAVLLLGFEAVRWAVLSAQVFEVVDGMTSAGGEVRRRRPAFDREAYWLHSMGVAIAAERIASAGTQTRDISPGEAFMAGLLHDIGQLLLHVLLPESFDRVCRMAEMHGASLDRACRQIIGLDTHTAGKKLAEHWGLPRSLVDTVWLSGQPPQAVPQAMGEANQTLIAVVSLADALVQSCYIAPGAHRSASNDLGTLSIPVGLGQPELDDITAELHDEVALRAAALGMNIENEEGVLLRSIRRANETLARANAGMRQREQLAQTQARALKGISQFYDALPTVGSVVEVLATIVQSANNVFEARIYAAVYRIAEDRGWRLVRFAPDGRVFGSRLIDPPGDNIPLAAILRDGLKAGSAISLAPWLDDVLPSNLNLDDLSTLPLADEDNESTTILLIKLPQTTRAKHSGFEELLQCWQTSLFAGARCDSAANLSEQLAEANRSLIEMQETLAKSSIMATLGEVAAGAAHEMNNPLTVISGRAQLLGSRLQDPELCEMATEISTQSHRLSDMITALKSFAEPIEPRLKKVDLADLVVRAVQRYGPGERRQPQVNTVFVRPVPMVQVDPDLIGSAVGELVRNAVEAKGSDHIELRVQTDRLDDRLKIEIRDDGTGLSEHVLKHAFDPFFSAKPAGRQPGLGLARARRAVEAHGGRITLVNGPGGGAIATIWLTDTGEEGKEKRRAA